MSLTDDPNDPRLSRGADDSPQDQNEVYLVLSEAERMKGFVRPYRVAYVHDVDGCGVVTRMGREIAETYARNPKFYGSTYCVGCHMHKPVHEFRWDGSVERVGS